MTSRSPAVADRGGELRLLAALLALALVSGLLPHAADAATGDPVLLNEFLASHTGSDTTEFVELYGVPGTSLAGLSLVAVEGDSTTAPGTVDTRVDFPASAHLGGNGFFLVGNPVGLAAAYHVTPDLAWPTDSLENGSQTLALVETASLGSATAVTGTETVRDAVAVTDTGPSDRWFWNAPVLGPDDGFVPAGGHRVVDGQDTDTVADWAFADDQLGTSNTPTAATPYNAPPTADCGPDVAVDEGTPVHASLTGSDPDGRVVSFSASPAPGSSQITVQGVTAASSAGGTATATLHVSGSAAPGSYVVTVTAANDDAPPQTADCQLQVTVNDVADPEPEPEPDPEPGPTDGTAALWATVNGMAGPKTSLLADRLARVDRFMAAGQTAAAAAQLQALANQAMGLSPRWLSADAAAVLATQAHALRSALHP